MEHLEGTLQKPPTTATKVKPKKFKLLVTTSEPIDTEHLSLFLEKAMDMKSNTDFYINVVGPKDWVVTLERTLSDEGIFIYTFEHMLKHISNACEWKVVMPLNLSAVKGLNNGADLTL